MKIVLAIKEKKELELQHSKERDRRVADPIKAVLLNAQGWTQKQIAQALRIRYETVQEIISTTIRIPRGLSLRTGVTKPS